MDQLRQVLGWLQRQHFWVLSGLVALIALACWWSGAGTLSQEFEANKSAINNEFNSMSTLQSKPFHPNDDVMKRQAEETEKQAERVERIWRQLYDRQREDVLEWPTVLRQDFLEYVDKLRFGEDIPPHLRDRYQNYVERHFPLLPKKVGARVMREDELGFGGEGGYGRGRMSFGREYSRGDGEMAGQLDVDDDYICEWLDQAVVREELDFPQRPSSIRIWVTQENLWVYHTLLDVIANTNKAAGATRMSNAAVRVIYSLEVGKRAATSSRGQGRIYKLPSAAALDPMMMSGEGGEGMMTEGGMYGGREGMMSGSEMFMDGRGEGGMMGMGTGPMTDEQERAMLLTWRYLNAEGKPISAGGGADPSMMGDPMMGDPMMGDPMMGGDPAATAGPIDPTTFGTEYKRLPVRMTLRMDQRWLTHLIAECANQPLQVEVQEVRINPPTSVGGEGAFGGGRGFEGGGMGQNLFPDRVGVQTFPAQPHMVDVVIQGIIYIFNEPNPDVLKPAEEELPLATM